MGLPASIRRATLLLASLAAGWVLAGCDAKATGDWLEDLKSPDSFTRSLAAVALAQSPEVEIRPVARALLRQLDDVETVRLRAEDSLRQLAERSPRTFVQLLVRASPGPQTALLLDALVRVGPAAAGPLRARMSDPDSPRRTTLAVAYGRLTANTADARRTLATELRGLTDGGEPAGHVVAIAALQAAGHDEAIEPLARAMAQQLRTAPSAARGPWLAALEDVSRESLLATFILDDEARQLEPDERFLVEGALVRGCLATLRHPTAVNSHDLAAGDGGSGETDVAPAPTFIGHLRQRALPHLVAALRSNSERRIKRWVAHWMANLGAPALEAMLADGVDDVWIDLVALALGERATPVFQDAVESGTPEVRQAAVRAARRLEDR